jgi:hypothetical protein
MSTIQVFDPTGHVQIQEASAALRPETLEGLRPGVLENRKANARVVMEAMIESIGEQVPLGKLTVGSKPVSGPPSDATLNRLVKNCDFVLVGSSD